jgi:hypothetical protein
LHAREIRNLSNGSAVANDRTRHGETAKTPAKLRAM